MMTGLTSKNQKALADTASRLAKTVTKIDERLQKDEITDEEAEQVLFTLDKISDVLRQNLDRPRRPNPYAIRALASMLDEKSNNDEIGQTKAEEYQALANWLNDMLKPRHRMDATICGSCGDLIDNDDHDTEHQGRNDIYCHTFDRPAKINSHENND